jgi:hypothetical protein
MKNKNKNSIQPVTFAKLILLTGLIGFFVFQFLYNFSSLEADKQDSDQTFQSIENQKTDDLAQLNSGVTDQSSFLNSDMTPEARENENKNKNGAEIISKNSDNFLPSLKVCNPELNTEEINTPEKLIRHLRETVGIQSEEVHLENFHLKLQDGSERRIHVITSDNTQSHDKKEIHFFSVDNEGYPVPIPIAKKTRLESLLSIGELTQHEMKSFLKLNDDSNLNLEEHNGQVFELQLNNNGKILSCRHSNCQCST